MLSCNRKRWSSYELALNWQQTRCYEVLEGKQHLSHKSHNASNKYHTMHPFATEMCTHVHISVTKWCIMGYGTGALWDLCAKFSWKMAMEMCKLQNDCVNSSDAGDGIFRLWESLPNITHSLVGVLQFYKISFVSFGEYWPLFWRKPLCILQGHVLIWTPELQRRWSHISWRHGVCGTCPTWSRRSRSTASCLPASWSNYGCAATPRWNKSKR